MYHRLLLVLVALVIALPNLALTAAAQEAEQDQAFREERRTMSFQTLPGDGFEARSTRSSDLGDDEMAVRFSLDDDRLRVRYVSSEPQNETVLTLDLSFLALVEFRDANMDGRYGFGDQEVQRLPLARMEDAPAVSENILSGGKVAMISYTIPRSGNESDGGLPVGNSSAPLLPGRLDLRFYLLPSTQVLDGNEVTPLDLKFDIEITDFPYQNAGRVALETRFAANGAVAAADWNERTLAVRDGFFHGFYAWSDRATVDGDPVRVGVTALSYGNGMTDGPDIGKTQAVSVAFAYPHGDKIVHDPQVGIMRMQGGLADVVERLIDGDWLLYSLGLAASIVAVGVPAAVRLRQGR